jgi:HEAT repeats
VKFFPAFLSKRARRPDWLDAATRLDLGDVVERPHGWFSDPSLTGTSGPLHVSLEEYRPDNHTTGTRITIDGLGYGAEPLTLKRESLGTRLLGREIETGDPVFDSEVHVQGPASLALAVLDAPAREQIARLLEGRSVAPLYQAPVPVTATFDRGVLEVKVQDGSEHVFLALREALLSAHQLAMPESLLPRLAENLQREASDGVRLSLVTLLGREYPGHPEALPAFRAVLQDASYEVRLQAAIGLGEEGHETLLQFVTHPEDSCAARAIGALGTKLPAERVTDLLNRALTLHRTQTALACLRSLGQGSTPADAPCEEALLRAFRSGDSPVVSAAAEALGRIGTAAAVSALKPEASSLLPGPLRSAARQAIAEIQSRLPGAAPGQLSLAAGEAGALSLAPGEAGELSLADSAPEQS